MRAVVTALLAAALVTCSCTHALTGPPTFRSPGPRVAYTASYRLVVFCNSEVRGFGSAVAVGSDLLMTAAHVVNMSCATAPTFLAVSTTGTVTAVVVARRHPHADLVTLTPGRDAFVGWAPVARRGCSFGEELHANIGAAAWPGDVPGNFTYKRLYASGYYVTNDVDLIQISGQIVAGNSGGGLFNDAGELVGIITQRDQTGDLRGVAVAISMVRQLL